MEEYGVQMTMVLIIIYKSLESMDEWTGFK